MSTLADVVLGLVRATVTRGESTDAPVYDVHVPDKPPARYVVLYPSPARHGYADLGGTRDARSYEWQITCVASTRAEVEWLAERTASIAGTTPAVEGLFCGPIQQDGAQPVRPDTTIPGRVVLYSTAQYSLTAQET